MIRIRKPEISQAGEIMERIRTYLFRNRAGIILTAILILAAFFRLYRISDYLTFLGDEGRDVLVVKRMIVDGKLTLLGPTSSAGGFFLGPLYYYMMAPFLWLFRLDPTGPAVMVALLSVLTVFLLYRLVKNRTGQWAGLMAAAIYAFSPLIIIQSRSSWNPNVTPFFAVLLASLLLDDFQRFRKYRYLLIGLVLGLGVQTHYLFLFLYAVAGVYLAVEKSVFGTKTGWRDIAAVSTGIILGISPLILFEIRHGFTNTAMMFRFLTEGKDTGFELGHFLQTSVMVFFRIFGTLIFRLPGYFERGKLAPLARLAWEALTVTGAVFLSGYALMKIKTGWKKNPAPIYRLYLLTAVWIFVPVTLFGFYRKGIYDYYFGILYAAPIILVALFFRRLGGLGRAGSVAATFGVAGLIGFLLWGSPLKKPPNRLMAQVREIARTAFAQTGNGPFNFALVADGNSDHAYRYFFEIWGKPPVTIENKDADPERKSVTGQLIVICETVDCQPLGNPLWEIAGFGRAEIAGSWQVPFVTIYRLVHYEEKTD